MTGITQIVDKMLLGENVDNDAILRDIEAMFDRENQLRELAKGEDLSFHFGFYISTGSSDLIEQNMKDDGVDTDEPGFWDRMTDHFMRLERNMVQVVSQNGLSLRPEGHGDNDLVGSAWLNIADHGRTNEIGINLVRDIIDGGEPLNTGSGSITTLKGFDAVYDGVDERLARAVELSFGLFDYAKVKKFLELLDGGTPMDAIIPALNLEESFLAPRDPPGIFRKIIDGVEIYSARCPGCKRIHGNFTNYDQAAGNRQCKFCTRDYVDKMTKVTTTGNFKHILKKPHETRASRSHR